MKGGAGSFSDGKLFSRTKNSRHINRVLDTFIKFGAPEEIGYVRKPHVGMDVLCRIVRNIRSYILERGGEIHYGSKVTDILISGDKVSGRVEHPAETINLIRYGNKYKEFPGIGAATYSFNYTNRKAGRGVHTFCMCPGG